MKKKVAPLFLSILSIATLASCGPSSNVSSDTSSDSSSDSSSIPSTHTHAYDLTNPVWNWVGYTKATVSFACSSCESDAEGHNKVVDASIKVKEKVDPTCTEAGKTVYEATASFEGQTFTDTKTLDKEATGHDKDETTWKSDATKHWHVCANDGCEERFDEADHTFGDWETVKESNHYDQGEKQRTCSVCDYVDSEKIAITKFSFAEVQALYSELIAFVTNHDERLPYACDMVSDLSYAVENVDTSSEGYTETSIAEFEKYINDYSVDYTVGADVKALSEGYSTARVSKEKNFQDFGNVLKINAPDGYESKNWTTGIDIKPSLLKAKEEGAVLFKFAVYSSLTGDNGINGFDIGVNDGKGTGDDSTWYDASAQKAVKGKKTVTVKGGQTAIIEIPASVLDDFEKIEIDIYMGNPTIKYGLPSLTDTSGSAYLTGVVAYKDTYYNKLKTEIETGIKALPEVADLTEWGGAPILELKEKYDALPSFVQEEVEGAEKLISLSTTFNAKYSIAVSSEDMDYSAALDTKVTSDNKYGRVLEMNTLEEKTDEGWALGLDLKPSLENAIKNGATSFTFAYYAPRPQNIMITNGTCDKRYDFDKKVIVTEKGEGEKTLNVGWTEFSIPTSIVSELDSIHIATYYMGNDNTDEKHGYGIPYASLNAGSAYMSDIIGIKTTADDVIAKISALDSKYSGKTLSVYNGGEIATVKEAYNSLVDSAKEKVTNYEKLVALEEAYKKVGVCYNTSYETGTLFKTSFESKSVIDDEKGLCVQFDNVTAKVFTFKPTTAMSLADGVSKVKVAIYNPTDSDVNAYILDKDWGDTVVDGVKVKERQPIQDVVPANSWKEFEIDAKYCLEGVVNTLEVGFQNAPDGTTSGWKITPLYSEVTAA